MNTTRRNLSNMLTLSEAAEQLRVSRQRVHQLIDMHNLTTVLVHSRLRLIHPRELKKIRISEKSK